MRRGGGRATDRAGAGASVLLATLAVLAGSFTLSVSPARAGAWIQVSCVNPNGTPSNAQGWSGSAAGSAPNVTNASVCGPGNPLLAEQDYVYAPPPSTSSSATLTYSPPAGSTLAGGSLSVSLAAYAYGQGTGQFSLAAVFAPDSSHSVETVGCPSAGCTGNTFSGTVTLPASTGGTVAVGVGCTTLSQPGTCDNGEEDGVYDEATVSSADLLLQTNAEPQASGFRGSALQRNASGTAGLVFSASDPVGSAADAPSGPGIFGVSVAIDGRVVEAGTPNTDNGSCVAVGTGEDGALMFDGQQPCPPAETVDVGVPTRGLPDGRHRLVVRVLDAGNQSAVVLDQYISTYNPQITPLPKGRTVRARFLLSWRWSGRTTRLRSVSVRHLPANAALSVSCRGRGCPRLATTASGAKAVKRLARSLGGHRFRAGDRLYLTVTAPRRRPERILLRIRDGKVPRAKLL